MSEKKKQIEFWGASAASFYAGCEGETINIHLVTGEVLSGELLGVDRYDLILERDNDARVLIPKHAIVYVELQEEKNDG